MGVRPRARGTRACRRLASCSSGCFAPRVLQRRPSPPLRLLPRSPVIVSNRADVSWTCGSAFAAACRVAPASGVCRTSDCDRLQNDTRKGSTRWKGRGQALLKLPSGEGWNSRNARRRPKLLFWERAGIKMEHQNVFTFLPYRGRRRLLEITPPLSGPLLCAW